MDAGTLAAIQRQALDLVIVSAERIAAEMRRMLVHSSRARAVELLREANLLEIVLPESSLLDDADWERTLAILRNLREPTFAAALAALLRGHCLGRLPAVVADRWKLANDERDGVELAYRHEAVLLEARRYAGQNGPRPLHPLQQALIEKRIDELLVYAEAVARVFQSDAADIGFCREVLNLPNELLNPPPLLTGNELKAAGFSAGPVFAKILGEVRRQQIDGLISTLDEALNLAKEIAAQQP